MVENKFTFPYRVLKHKMRLSLALFLSISTVLVPGVERAAIRARESNEDEAGIIPARTGEREPCFDCASIA